LINCMLGARRRTVFSFLTLIIVIPFAGCAFMGSGEIRNSASRLLKALVAVIRDFSL